MKKFTIYTFSFLVAFVILGNVNRPQKSVASEKYAFLPPKIVETPVEPKIEIPPSPKIQEPVPIKPIENGISYTPNCENGSCQNGSFRIMNNSSCGVLGRGGWYPGKIIGRVFRR